MSLPVETTFSVEGEDVILSLQLMSNMEPKIVRITKLPAHRLEEAVEFCVRHFLLREPLIRCFVDYGHCVQTRHDELYEFLTDWGNPDYSYIALDVTPSPTTFTSTTNVSGSSTITTPSGIVDLSSAMIVGVSLSRPTGKEHYFNAKNKLTNFTDDCVRYISLLHLTEATKLNVFERYQVSTVFELGVLAVDLEFSNRKIGTTLIEKTLSAAKKNGFKVIMVDCTSHFLYKAVLKLGFKEIEKVNYEDHPFEKNGEEREIDPDYPHQALHICTSEFDPKRKEK